MRGMATRVSTAALVCACAVGAITIPLVVLGVPAPAPLTIGAPASPPVSVVELPALPQRVPDRGMADVPVHADLAAGAPTRAVRLPSSPLPAPAVSTTPPVGSPTAPGRHFVAAPTATTAPTAPETADAAPAAPSVPAAPAVPAAPVAPTAPTAPTAPGTAPPFEPTAAGPAPPAEPTAPPASAPTSAPAPQSAEPPADAAPAAAPPAPPQSDSQRPTGTTPPPVATPAEVVVAPGTASTQGSWSPDRRSARRAQLARELEGRAKTLEEALLAPLETQPVAVLSIAANSQRERVDEAVTAERVEPVADDHAEPTEPLDEVPSVSGSGRCARIMTCPGFARPIRSASR